MEEEISIDANELNLILIVVTASVLTVALLALLIIVCKMSCSVCRPSPNRRPSNIPHVMITQHRDKTPLSLDCPDLDFIDSKNTNLISSTVFVDSVHQTPSLS